MHTCFFLLQSPTPEYIICSSIESFFFDFRPKTGEEKLAGSENLPSLAPPPKSPSGANAFQDSSPRFNPFDNTQEVPFATTENIFAQGK